MSETAQVSSLPLPPMQYVTLFSEENSKRGRTPRPPPPITDNYSMFGNPYNTDDAVIRPLESQNIRRLYPNNYDHRRELKKLNHSITASFLDLVDICIRNPESEARATKIDDITLLFIHMHHLVNEFRPHQARETLRVMLEQQKRQRLEIAERFRRHFDKSVELVQQAVSTIPEPSETNIKLLIDIERVQPSEGNASNQSNEDGCAEEDRVLCQIIDSL
uniref:Mediator of RNA polymerase II transcription subunit 7 n=1 Tax=Ceriodaphnia reticulata TaxID=302197 RepID=A0A4Y7M0J4_9CRUS|nr:EOG090X0EJA [Ceriodaphnia reticulata]SVE73219.1 EOG090X0EJA [Ceriodaphnia reticulata]